MGLAKNAFGTLMAGVMAVTPMAAMADDAAVAANNNVATASVSSVSTRPYPSRDITNVRYELAEEGVTYASEGRIVITLWGGSGFDNDALLTVADRLYAEGHPVSYYRAGDNDQDSSDGLVTIHSDLREQGRMLITSSTSNIGEQVYENGVLLASELRQRRSLASLSLGTD